MLLCFLCWKCIYVFVFCCCCCCCKKKVAWRQFEWTETCSALISVLKCCVCFSYLNFDSLVVGTALSPPPSPTFVTSNYVCKSGSDLCSWPNIVGAIKSRRMRWGGHVVRMGEERGVYRVLVEKLEGRRPLGRPRRRWVNNIRMDLQEVGCG